jgi:hypothetical protein
MTKKVRVENADIGEAMVVVQTWEKICAEGQPDVLVNEVVLRYPTSITGNDCFISSTRYLMVKEVPKAD